MATRPPYEQIDFHQKEEKLDIQYNRLPEHMRGAARLYIERGLVPGDFMMAVLCNNFTEAVGAADSINRHALFDWAMWLHNDIPHEAWGSKEEVLSWSNRKIKERA